MTAVQCRPDVYRLEQPDGKRRLCQYVLVGDDRTLVVDAGLPDSPEQGVLPLLRELDLDRRPVVVVLTHPDADHRGGAPVLRSTGGDVEIWGHALDRAQLEHPDVVLAERYRAFEATDGIGPSVEGIARMRARLGDPVTLDRALTGDASLDLGGKRAEILHAPGHSPGSLAVWSPDTSTALIGDAVMGRGVPFIDGTLMYPPMYDPPRAYLETISRLELLSPTLLLSGHEPPIEGDDVPSFLAESRASALRISSLVLETLDVAPNATLADLCSAVAMRYGGFQDDRAESFAMTVDGTLRELAWQGSVEIAPGPPRRFSMCP